MSHVVNNANDLANQSLQIRYCNIFATWLILNMYILHLYVWHGIFNMLQGALTRETWLIHTGDMTHLHVWHDSFTRETWLIHTCDMSYSYVYVHHITHTRCAPHSFPERGHLHFLRSLLCMNRNLCVRHNFFICATSLVHKCNLFTQPKHNKYFSIFPRSLLCVSRSLSSDLFCVWPSHNQDITNTSPFFLGFFCVWTGLFSQISFVCDHVSFQRELLCCQNSD